MNVSEDLLALVDQRIRAASAVTRAIGTCVDVNDAGPGALVTFDGSDTAVPVKVLGHVMLRPGGRCVLDKYGSEWLVTGAFASPTLGISNLYAFSGTTSTSSTSFVDMAGTGTLPFTKYHDTTNLEIDQTAAGYTNVTNSEGRWGVRFVQTEGDTPYTPVDYNGAHVYWTGAIHHAGRAQFRVIGVPAGTYTITTRWKVDGGGPIAADANDLQCLVVKEFVHPSTPNL